MNSSRPDAIPGLAARLGAASPFLRQVLFRLRPEIDLFMMQDRKSFISWLQAGPMMLIFALFFLLPLVFVTIVSAWDYNEYEMIPAFSLRGYSDTFEGCIADLP